MMTRWLASADSSTRKPKDGPSFNSSARIRSPFSSSDSFVGAAGAGGEKGGFVLFGGGGQGIMGQPENVTINNFNDDDGGRFDDGNSDDY